MSIMTKDEKKNVAAHVTAINYGQMWAFWDAESGFPAYNPGRDDSESWGEPTTQIPLGMSDGYDLSKGTMVAVDVETAKRIFAELAEKESDETLRALYSQIAKNPVKVAMQQRKERAAELRKDGDKTCKYVVSNPNKPSEDIALEVSNRHVADILDSFAKVEPELFVVCGQRRFFAGGHTLALAEKRNETNPLDYQWFASVKTFDNVTALHDTVLQENQQNERQTYSAVGLARNAIRLLNERPLIGETDLGRLLGLADRISAETGKVVKSFRGTRQQMRRLAALALALPDLEIGRRIGLPETVYADSHATKAGKVKYVKGDYLPIGKLHKEDVACLLGERKEPTDVIKHIIPSYEKGKRATEAECEKYFRTVMDGEKPRGAITPKELQTYANIARIGNAEVKVSEIVKAIVEGDTDWFDNLNK